MSKFIMLRATTKQTHVKFEGQFAKNDDYYEDVTTSTDFWLVFADGLRKYFDQVEVWFQEDIYHPEGKFVHSTGLIERYFKKGYNFKNEKEPDILFVRGSHKEYETVIARFPLAQKVYYPSGFYYFPTIGKDWDVCFTEDPNHMQEVEKRTQADVFLFKKSCVAEPFLSWNCEKEYDLCFICGAKERDRKRLHLLKTLLDQVKNKFSVLVMGLKSEKVIEEFKDYNVTFGGFINRKEIGKYMSKCRAGTVLSSYKGDGSPRVIQEFLASNIPILVCSDSVFSPYYINEKTGVVGNTSSLGYDAENILTNMDRFSPRQYFLEELTMEKSVEHFMDCVYRKRI